MSESHSIPWPTITRVAICVPYGTSGVQGDDDHGLDGHSTSLPNATRGDFSLALECPSCQRTSWATLILGSKAYEPERMPTVRMSEGFTVRLGSTLEIRCGHCDVAVWQHNEPISEL